ncbi:MAG TPA: TonB family protein [Longimicrobiales bacterium]|nr:TonB family protein [Longimicrobiales bacterium]
MFNKLIESSGDRFAWLKHPWTIGISIVLHVVLVGSLMWVAAAKDARASDDYINPEDITYIDVTEVPPPPEVEDEPEPEPERPQPQVQEAAPAPAPRPPRVTPPAVTEPDRPAGFQELRPPREAIGVPPPQPQEAVSAEDFGGRGTPGGVAGGTPPPPGPPAAEAGAGAGGEGVDPNATYTANAVDRVAELRNRGDVATTMRRLYPSHLRDAGVGGRVVAQFVVTADGRVDAGSIRIISAAHPQLGEQTRRAIADFRFRPAQKGNRNVRQLVQMPIVWQPAD